MAYEFPTDPEFRRVAAKIADAVTVAINTETALDECALYRVCIGVCGSVSYKWDCNFSNGFWGIVEGPAFVGGEPVYQLGLAYRRRFVEGVK